MSAVKPSTEELIYPNIKNKTREQCLEWLVTRFYFLKVQGSQTFYWDAKEDVSGLSKQHLIFQLMQYGADYPTAEKAYNSAKTMFNPIVASSKYRPNKPPVVNVNGNLHPNLWRDDGAKPDSSISAQPWLDHLTLMMGDKQRTNYLVQLLAFKKQQINPRSKLHITPYLYGNKGGMGKSLLSDTICKVFGESSVMRVAEDSALTSKSGIDIWKRDFTIVEEVAVKRGKQTYNQLKAFTGQDWQNAERKNEHFGKHETPAMLIMLSNSAPTFIEEHDRRFFISEWMHDFESIEAKNTYFNSLIDWLENQGGYSAIAAYLDSVPVTIDPAAPALMTEEKQRITTLASNPAVSEIKALLEDNPERVLWQLEDFDEVFDLNDISNRKQKNYTAAEAGLDVLGSKAYRIGDKLKRACYLVREGWVMDSRSGKASMLKHKKLGKEYPASEDAGWFSSRHNPL